MFYSNGRLAVQLSRHSQYCWSTSNSELTRILQSAEGGNAFYIKLNRIIHYLCVSNKKTRECLQRENSIDEEIFETRYDSTPEEEDFTQARDSFTFTRK